MRIDSLPRFPLAHLPTQLEELKALSRQLAGPDILIKRDDQTGLALGGNKTRKLEFLLGDALAKGADTLITLGAVQSNHCRQSAGAAAKAGLRCELILNGKKPDVANGNLLLNELLGANLHWIERPHRAAKLAELDAQLRAQGRQRGRDRLRGGHAGVGGATAPERAARGSYSVRHEQRRHAGGHRAWRADRRYHQPAARAFD